MVSFNQAVVVFISCTLSVMGTSFIIFNFLAGQQSTKPAKRLLFWLSVADLGTALVYIYPGKNGFSISYDVNPDNNFVLESFETILSEKRQKMSIIFNQHLTS